mgnify:FL=1
MRTLAEGGNTMNDSALAAGAAPIKKAKKSRKQLFFELEETKSELEKLRRTHTLVSQERDRLRSEVEGLNDRVEDLEHKRIESNRLNAELSIRLEAMQAHTEARDKDVESMEQRLLSKVNELSKSESELSKKLKQSLASQSRLEQQMIELRGTRSNAEQERSDLSKNLSHTKHELEKMRHDLKHLRTDNRQLKEENDTMKAKVQRATEALVNAREYIRTLEISDTQIRTAIAVVQKQNRTLAAFNSTLKAELGEAKAQLAMQLALEQQYDQLEDDQLPDLGVDESDLIACGIAPPPPPNPNDPTSFVTYNLLSVIPNPVAARKVPKSPSPPPSPQAQNMWHDCNFGCWCRCVLGDGAERGSSSSGLLGREQARSGGAHRPRDRRGSGQCFHEGALAASRSVRNRGRRRRGRRELGRIAHSK